MAEEALQLEYEGKERAAVETWQPLATFAGTHFWRVTNILSNITPQKSNLNRAPWLRLESAVRDAAYVLREVYVVTGPLFDSGEKRLRLPKADEDHEVPTGYIKVIAHERSKRVRLRPGREKVHAAL